MLLNACRISSVMGLSASELNDDAAGAKQAIDLASREAQLRGWEFNTDYGLSLAPDPSGAVSLPENTLKVRNIRCDNRRLTRRGLRLYDPQKHTFSIGSSVKVDLVNALEFDDLPEGFKLYVTALAARRWCPPKLPTGSTFQYTEEFLNAALAAAEQEDLETADATLPDTSPHFANMLRR